MRRSVAVLVSALFACSAALAQINRDESSGIGPGGRGSTPAEPPSTPKRPPAPATTGCSDPTFAGKYSNELRRLNVPADRARYGTCRDYGAWSGNSYAGQTGLPNGYWVYSYPNWIIYANRGTARQ